jgi:hypothetical protein
MGFLSAPHASSPAAPRADWVSRVALALIIGGLGVVLGLQYWNPNSRAIPVVGAVLMFGIAWRLDMVAAISLLVLLLPYPKGTVFGSTNLASVLLVFIIWLLRVSLRMSPPARSSPVAPPIFLMLLWYILSFYNVETPLALQRGLQNFALFIACVLFYFLIVNSIRTQRDLERLHAAQLISAFTVFLVAALESRMAGRVFIPGLIDFSGTVGTEFFTRDVRVGASFRDYELLSEYCGIVFLLVCFMWLRAHSQTRRWVLGLFAVFNLYTMFTTVTRGVIVSLAIAVPYLLFTIRRRLNPVRFMSGALLVTVLFLVMNQLVATYTNSGDMFKRMAETRVVHGIVPEARAEPWLNAWERALVHPILGHGPYYDLTYGFGRFWPHNLYLFVANVIGFPGLLFFLLLLFGLVRILRPVVDDLRHASYADAYLVVARTQLLLFMLNELKIDYLRNPIYIFQVWMWFGTWTAAYLISREHGVRAARRVEDPAPAAARALTA